MRAGYRGSIPKHVATVVRRVTRAFPKKPKKAEDMADVDGPAESRSRSAGASLPGRRQGSAKAVLRLRGAND